MSLKKIVVTVSAIVLFIFPSMNRSVRAEETKYTDRNSRIMTLQDAASLTKIIRVATVSNEMLVNYFGKDVIEKVLTQPGCVKVQMYYAKTKEGKPTLILFGIDKKGNEMIAGLIPYKPCPTCKPPTV